MADLPVRILLVEDEPAHAVMIQRAFAGADPKVVVQTVETLAAYRAAVADAPPNIALLDLNLPDGRAVEALTYPPEDGAFPILIMTSFGTEKVAVEAMKAGAIDYMVKSPEAFALMPKTVARVLREWSLLNQRRHAEQAMVAKEQRFRAIASSIQDALVVTDPSGHITFWNPSAERIFGYAAAEVMGRDLHDFLAPERFRASYAKARENFANTGAGPLVGKTVEVPARHRDGTEIPVDLSISSFLMDGQWHAAGVLRDIRERKQKDREREQAIELLRLCNEAEKLPDFAKRFVEFFHELTGCEAVGVRLRSEEGYPHFAQRGFSPEFVATQQELIVRDDDGRPRHDCAGKPLLECLCGKVISGQIDASLKGFTAYGSFWTNRFSTWRACLLEETSAEWLRDTCHHAGYESLALIPLRLGGVNYGLFQFCDSSPDHFDQEKIALLENLVAQVAIALAKIEGDEALAESSEFSRQIINSAEEGFVVLGEDRHFQVWNPYMEGLTGILAAEVLGRHPQETFPKLADTGFMERVDVARAGHVSAKIDLALAHLGARAQEGWATFAFAPLCNSKGDNQGVIITVQDITLRKRYEQELEFRANHDTLTGLANRNLMRDRLRQSLFFAERTNRIVAVMFLDLDRFKTINDSLGHSQGDELLKLVAKRLETCAREGDTVSRLGGDEFALIFSEIAELDDVAQMAQRVQQALAGTFHLAGRELPVSTSIGISLFPRDGDDPDDLLRQADIAMFRAKEEGRGRISLYAPEMNARVVELLDLEAEMRQGIKEKEFVLHYQPKVNITTGRIEGCEALVRWQNPSRGFISPAQFIPLAEDTGLIVPLGEWIFREACLQARSWIDAGLPPLTLSVNISARQFREPGLCDTLAGIVAETGVPPQSLEIELTESLLMSDPADAAETMRQLKSLGFTISLDDFGTGYSSLNYLRRFPVDCLKIDRSFVVDAEQDASGAAMIAGIVAIAHGLGMSAIAEGVETLEQLQLLARCNCDAIQGYFFSKPLPAADFIRIVQEGKTLPPYQQLVGTAEASL